MLLTFSKTTLAPALKQAASMVSAKPAVEAMKNILLTVRGNQVELTGATAEMELTVTAPMNGTESGGMDFGEDSTAPQFTVPAKQWNDFVQSLPDNAEIKMDVGNDAVEIKSGRTKLKLGAIPATDYPSLMSWEAVSELTLPVELLKQMLMTVQNSVAVNDARFFLCGVKMEIENQEIRFIATDGHRLSVAKYQTEQDYPKVDLIIPREAMLELLKLLKTISADEVKIKIGSNQIAFALGDVVFNSKLIDGRFPAWDRVVPRFDGDYVVFDRAEFKTAVQRCNLLRDDKLKAVVFEMGENAAQLSVTGKNGVEALNDEVGLLKHYRETETGATPMIALNINYMQDVLNVIDAQAVRLDYYGAQSACKFTPVIEDDEETESKISSLHVLMPMRV